jgi:hypothetical protein
MAHGGRIDQIITIAIKQEGGGDEGWLDNPKTYPKSATKPV